MFKLDLNPYIHKETNASNNPMAQSSQILKINTLQQLFQVDIKCLYVYMSIPIISATLHVLQRRFFVQYLGVDKKT